ncbi:MAG TPA: AAC(3) family N-acetyltransferase [Polyangia bacterium]
MTWRIVATEEVVAQLRALGVREGAVLVVHTAYSRVGPVEGGPAGLIAALQTAIGPRGTLVLPSMSDDDDVPFDGTRTSCRALGITADTFWRLPGVLRSDNPLAFAARGPEAGAITAPHPLEVPHGLDSPPGRAYQRGGQILLLGVGHDANTTIHVAEAMAKVRYRARHHVTVLRDGRPVRIDYEETDHCCERFALMDEWLEARGQPRGQQRRGTVGNGEARLCEARDVVAHAVAQLEREETVFLHPPGVDDECDRARASLDGVAPG